MPANVRLNKQAMVRFMNATEPSCEQALEALAREGERMVKQSFGSGVSRPGQSPGVDTGTLRNSINVSTPKRLTRSIGTGVDYAIYLEFGSRKMAARPYMVPMVLKLEKEVTSIFSTFLKAK